MPFRTFTLGGALLAGGYEVLFFDQEHDLDRQNRLTELAEQLDRCVAAFIWLNEMYPSNQSANAHRLSVELKRMRPGIPVVAGGEFIAVVPAEMFDIETPIDYFLRGYGEESSLRLIEHLANGEAPDDVAGLVWRSAGGALCHNPIGPRVAFRPEFLELYDRLDLSCYVQTGGVFGNDRSTLTISGGRGCVKGCSFCVWSSHPSTLLDARHYFDLMVALSERYDVRQFHIGELDFFTSRKRALELARRLAAQDADIKWYALGSPIDLVELTDDDWDLLRDGGLAKVEMGSESGSTRLLRSIGKQHTAEDVYDVTVRMLNRGIVPMNNFLFGFPGETAADRAASLQLIDRLMRLSFDRTHFTYRHFQPAWYTETGAEALRHAPDRPRRIDRWLVERASYAQEGVRTMPWLPAGDEAHLKRIINYDLPLATSRFAIESLWRRQVYRALRLRAQRSLRHNGGRERRLDRWLFDHVVGGRLDRTFVP